MLFKVGDEVRIITNNSHPKRQKFDSTRDIAAGSTSRISNIRMSNENVCFYTLVDNLAGYSEWPDFLLETAVNPNYSTLHLLTGVIITLTDGTRIYQPTSGNPIQLLKDPNDSNRPIIF